MGWRWGARDALCSWGLLPPSSPTPYLGPLSHLPLQPAAGDAIRIPLIAFFHPRAFLCSKRSANASFITELGDLGPISQRGPR